MDALFNESYVNEEHMQAYAEVLRQEEAASHGIGRLDSVRPVSAASDFAPICEPVKKGQDERDMGTRIHMDRSIPEGIMYSIMRWPLLGIIFLFIFTEFALYVTVRQVVNIMEKFSSWNGKNGKLRQSLRDAQTYPEWKRTALEFDRFRKYDEWKANDASPFYDWRLVQRVIAAMKVTRQKEDAHALMGVLHLCLKHGFAGIENLALYSQSFYGTKHLIEQYYYEVDKALQFFEKSTDIEPRVKRAFYNSTSKNLGRTALCLSGGASFAYYHIGVVRALLDGNLLPNIISGTSAGGLIAALICTRTNEELKDILVPELAHKITGCDDPLHVWIVRAWKTGARFDAVTWARKVQFFTHGSLTFREAFERTGKTLNISVVPFDQHSPAQLLNHVTAPDCLIWSAVLASAAVPGILNPVFLMQKQADGTLKPWSYGNKFRDGSLRVDIPLEKLHSLFNVTYPIVSQVNPHVHLFHYGSRGAPGRPTAYRRGRGWRGGFLLSAAEHILKLNLITNFKIMRDLNLMPKLLGQDWSSVFLQDFAGSITIYPKTRIMDWPHILTDPDPSDLARMMRSGQYVTFPKLHMISNRVRIERAIARGRSMLRAMDNTSDKEDESDTEVLDASLDASEMIMNAGGNGTPKPATNAWEAEQEDVMQRTENGLLKMYSPNLYRFLDEYEMSNAPSPAESDGEGEAGTQGNGSSVGARRRRRPPLLDVRRIEDPAHRHQARRALMEMRRSHSESWIVPTLCMPDADDEPSHSPY